MCTEETRVNVSIINVVGVREEVRRRRASERVDFFFPFAFFAVGRGRGGFFSRADERIFRSGNRERER